MICDASLKKAIIEKNKCPPHLSEVEGDRGNPAEQTSLTHGPWISVTGVDRETQAMLSFLYISLRLTLTISQMKKENTEYSKTFFVICGFTYSGHT